MHNSMIGSTGMDQESHIAHENQYSGDNWAVDMNTYAQTTMPDYGGYGYMPPITHGLPSESLMRMPPPPPPQVHHHQHHQQQQQHHHHHPHHQQLTPLITPPHPTWPSMLTNPTNASYPAPPIPIPPMSQLKTTKSPSTHMTSQPRKTLTDDDRRAMCEFHEKNPGCKQTEIGARFGVERSTVSKVLRHKEKYLHSEDRSGSPIKRNKNKFPDIERALANWVRNAQKSGTPLSDRDIKDKAQFFNMSLGNSDTHLKTMNSSWLEKFKQKNGIGQGRLTRRASETNIPDSTKLSANESPRLMPGHLSGGISPASPTAQPSPSPLSASRSEEEKEGLSAYMDYTPDSASYKHANSQSTTSLNSAVTDTGNSTFSGGTFSPTGLTFSPDGSNGGFLSNDPNRQNPPGGAASNFQRPRSQTFPTLDLEYMNAQQSSEAATPKFPVSATEPSSALESPIHEMPAPNYGMDSTISSPPPLHHSASNSSLTGRSTGGMISTPAGSSPTSPTQEDARRAADTLLSFFQSVGHSGLVDQNELNTLARLTDKLRLHQHQQAKGLGGLSRIPEGECEMSGAATTMARLEPTMSV